MAKRRLLLLGVGLALAGNAPAQGQKALGELFSGDASVRGSVLLRAQATEVLSGSQVAAGEGSALLKLARGGQLRICPKTNLSLNADVRGKSLSLGLNAGAMELEYALESGADSLITPDFRLQLIGPGSFHLAISVATSGDTCLRSLPGNSAAVFVSEMMGSDSYQLSPGKNVLFLKGKISLATAAPELCGCPQIAPPSATELARTDPAENARPHPDRKNLATAATDRQPTNGQPVPVERPVPLEEKPRLSQERSPAAAAVSPAQPAEEQVRRAPASASLPSVSTKPEAPDTGQKKPEPSNAEPSNLEHPNPEPSASEQSNPEPSNTESSKQQSGPPVPATPAQPAVAHLEVESRFSYRGDEAVQDFYTAAARLSLFSDNSKLAMALLPQVKPPQGSPPQVSRPAQASAPAVAAPSPESATPRPGEGFLHRFFRRLFGH